MKERDPNRKLDDIEEEDEEEKEEKEQEAEQQDPEKSESNDPLPDDHVDGPKETKKTDDTIPETENPAIEETTPETETPAAKETRAESENPAASEPTTGTGNLATSEATPDIENPVANNEERRAPSEKEVTPPQNASPLPASPLPNPVVECPPRDGKRSKEALEIDAKLKQLFEKAANKAQNLEATKRRDQLSLNAPELNSVQKHVVPNPVQPLDKNSFAEHLRKLDSQNMLQPLLDDDDDDDPLSPSDVSIKSKINIKLSNLITPNLPADLKKSDSGDAKKSKTTKRGLKLEQILKSKLAQKLAANSPPGDGGPKSDDGSSPEKETVITDEAGVGPRESTVSRAESQPAVETSETTVLKRKHSDSDDDERESKMAKLDDDDVYPEGEEEIEEPVMLVTGPGSGRDCDTGNNETGSEKSEPPPGGHLTHKVEDMLKHSDSGHEAASTSEDAAVVSAPKAESETPEKRKPKLWTIDAICNTDSKETKTTRCDDDVSLFPNYSFNKDHKKSNENSLFRPADAYSVFSMSASANSERDGRAVAVPTNFYFGCNNQNPCFLPAAERGVNSFKSHNVKDMVENLDARETNAKISSFDVKSLCAKRFDPEVGYGGRGSRSEDAIEEAKPTGRCRNSRGSEAVEVDGVEFGKEVVPSASACETEDAVMNLSSRRETGECKMEINRTNRSSSAVDGMVDGDLGLKGCVSEFDQIDGSGKENSSGSGGSKDGANVKEPVDEVDREVVTETLRPNLLSVGGEKIQETATDLSSSRKETSCDDGSANLDGGTSVANEIGSDGSLEKEIAPLSEAATYSVDDETAIKEADSTSPGKTLSLEDDSAAVTKPRSILEEPVKASASKELEVVNASASENSEVVNASASEKPLAPLDEGEASGKPAVDDSLPVSISKNEAVIKNLAVDDGRSDKLVSNLPGGLNAETEKPKTPEDNKAEPEDLALPKNKELQLAQTVVGEESDTVTRVNDQPERKDDASMPDAELESGVDAAPPAEAVSTPQLDAESVGANKTDTPAEKTEATEARTAELDVATEKSSVNVSVGFAEGERKVNETDESNEEPKLGETNRQGGRETEESFEETFGSVGEEAVTAVASSGNLEQVAETSNIRENRVESVETEESRPGGVVESSTESKLDVNSKDGTNRKKCVEAAPFFDSKQEATRAKMDKKKKFAEAAPSIGSKLEDKSAQEKSAEAAPSVGSRLQEKPEKKSAEAAPSVLSRQQEKPEKKSTEAAPSVFSRQQEKPEEKSAEAAPSVGSRLQEKPEKKSAEAAPAVDSRQVETPDKENVDQKSAEAAPSADSRQDEKPEKEDIEKKSAETAPSVRSKPETKLGRENKIGKSVENKVGKSVEETKSVASKQEKKLKKENVEKKSVEVSPSVAPEREEKSEKAKPDEKSAEVSPSVAPRQEEKLKKAKAEKKSAEATPPVAPEREEKSEKAKPEQKSAEATPPVAPKQEEKLKKTKPEQKSAEATPSVAPKQEEKLKKATPDKKSAEATPLVAPKQEEKPDKAKPDNKSAEVSPPVAPRQEEKPDKAKPDKNSSEASPLVVPGQEEKPEEAKAENKSAEVAPSVCSKQEKKLKKENKAKKSVVVAPSVHSEQKTLPEREDKKEKSAETAKPKQKSKSEKETSDEAAPSIDSKPESEPAENNRENSVDVSPSVDSTPETKSENENVQEGSVEPTSPVDSNLGPKPKKKYQKRLFGELRVSTRSSKSTQEIISNDRLSSTPPMVKTTRKYTKKDKSLKEDTEKTPTPPTPPAAVTRSSRKSTQLILKIETKSFKKSKNQISKTNDAEKEVSPENSETKVTKKGKYQTSKVNDSKKEETVEPAETKWTRKGKIQASKMEDDAKEEVAEAAETKSTRKGKIQAPKVEEDAKEAASIVEPRVTRNSRSLRIEESPVETVETKSVRKSKNQQDLAAENAEIKSGKKSKNQQDLPVVSAEVKSGKKSKSLQNHSPENAETKSGKKNKNQQDILAESAEKSGKKSKNQQDMPVESDEVKSSKKSKNQHTKASEVDSAGLTETRSTRQSKNLVLKLADVEKDRPPITVKITKKGKHQTASLIEAVREEPVDVARSTRKGKNQVSADSKPAKKNKHKHQQKKESIGGEEVEDKEDTVKKNKSKPQQEKDSTEGEEGKEDAVKKNKSKPHQEKDSAEEEEEDTVKKNKSKPQQEKDSTEEEGKEDAVIIMYLVWCTY